MRSPALAVSLSSPVAIACLQAAEDEKKQKQNKPREKRRIRTSGIIFMAQPHGIPQLMAANLLSRVVNGEERQSPQTFCLDSGR